MVNNSDFKSRKEGTLTGVEFVQLSVYAIVGRHKSGLLKMIGIGLGKDKGAMTLYSRGFENMEDSIKKLQK